MKRTAISRKPSPKQAEREAQRKKVVAELKVELGDWCERCKGHTPYWIPITGHEIVFRSKGIKSCKMDRTNIILVDGKCHTLAQAGGLTCEYLQSIVDKRNGQLVDNKV